MSRNNQARVETQIAQISKNDPVLYSSLKLLMDDIYKSFDQLFPVQAQQLTTLVSGVTTIPAGVLTFTYTLRLTSIHLEWTSNDPNIALYELREGTDWDTANFITRTPSLSADVLPSAGLTQNYLIRTINSSGTYQTGSTALTVTIPNLGSTSISPITIDNNVLLYWTEPFSSFKIDHYIVKKGGVQILTVNATFANIFESIGGTFVYSVTPVDIFGNIGPEISISVTVAPPTDFEIQDSRTSDLSGTKTKCILEDNKLLACVDITKDFQHHFDDNAWTDPAAQVAAGYPLYIEPTETTGQYQEVIDYGVAIDNIVFNVGYTKDTFVGSVAVVVSIEGKVNIGDPWSTPIVGITAFFASVRYIRVTLDFTGVDDKSLVAIYDLMFSLTVKKEVDSGEANALAADAGGTVVSFNKAFKDVDSVTAVANDTVQKTCVVDFTDVPNPTDFKVLVFDAAGVRVDALIYWKARGII